MSCTELVILMFYSCSSRVNHPLYHLAIVRLGVQYANRVVLGSNARCLALLYALKEVFPFYYLVDNLYSCRTSLFLTLNVSSFLTDLYLDSFVADS